MSRLMNGFVNVTEARYFEKLDKLEKLNNELQALGILQVQAEMTEIIQHKWEWFETLPLDYQENGLFIENIKDELRQEASSLIYKQREMGMDKSHLQQLEEMLVIS